MQKFPPVRRLYFKPNMDGGDDYFALYCNAHAMNIKKKGKNENIEGYDWLRYPETGGEIV